MKITDILNAIQSGQIRITDHADEEAQNDRLSYDEIFSSVLSGAIIEDYLDDKPYPSCLVAGNTFKGKPVQVYGHITKKRNGQCWLRCTDQTMSDG